MTCDAITNGRGTSAAPARRKRNRSRVYILSFSWQGIALIARCHTPLWMNRFGRTVIYVTPVDEGAVLPYCLQDDHYAIYCNQQDINRAKGPVPYALAWLAQLEAEAREDETSSV